MGLIFDRRRCRCRCRCVAFAVAVAFAAFAFAVAVAFVAFAFAALARKATRYFARLPCNTSYSAPTSGMVRLLRSHSVLVRV